MTDTRTSDQSPIESRLRAAGAAFPQSGVPDGAWQENQRRLLATSATRRGPDRRLLLVAAAGVVALMLGAGAVLLGGGGGPNRGTPAEGGDSFADSVVLGPPVEVESLRLGGVQTSHEAVLSDTTGEGPNLCDRYVSSGGSAGGCTSRDPRADDPGVAFDWLTGTSGSGNIRGVLAGVDSRVAKVQIWMDNGDEILADLKPGTWQGTKLFGLTVPADGPRPQRLVAYSDASGTVLQTVDLGDRFVGGRWLRPGGKTCEGVATGTWAMPSSGGTSSLSVELFSRSAKVIVTSSDPIGSTCLTLLPGALAGWSDVAGHLVVVAGPEVVTVEVRSAGKLVATQLKVTPTSGSIYGVAALPGLPPRLTEAELVARDNHGHVVDRAPFMSSSS